MLTYFFISAILINLEKKSIIFSWNRASLLFLIQHFKCVHCTIILGKDKSQPPRNLQSRFSIWDQTCWVYINLHVPGLDFHQFMDDKNGFLASISHENESCQQVAEIGNVKCRTQRVQSVIQLMPKSTLSLMSKKYPIQIKAYYHL